MNANEMISPEEQAEEQIEVHVEDHGIGHYEFWGSKEFDSRPCLALTNSEIMVQVMYNMMIRGSVLNYIFKVLLLMMKVICN